MIRWKMVEADDNAFVSPFPRLSSLLLVFEDSQTGSPPIVRRTGSKSGRLSTGEGRGWDFIVGQFIPHSQSCDRYVESFCSEGGRGPSTPGEELLFIVALNSTRSRALL